MQNWEEVQLAVAALRQRLGAALPSRPDAAIILGTGLSGLVERMEDTVSVPYADLPGFPVSTVASHAGAFVQGRLGGRTVLVQQGRCHLYEGFGPDKVCMGVRVMAGLGADTLILTNAAGALDPQFDAGGLMCISDQINFTGVSPLSGPNHEAWGERFPDMSAIYDAGLRDLACRCALELGIRLERGVYIGVRGCGAKLPKNRRDGQKYIVDFNAYTGEPNTYPIFPYNATPFVGGVKADVKFLVLQLGAPSEEYMACLKAHPEVVVVAVSNQQNRLGEQRALTHELWSNGLFNPVVFAQMYSHTSAEKADLQLEAAADMGALMIDGLCDGVWLMNNGDIAVRDLTDTAFAILQAARLRTSKTEYISCPGCGRTLYDLRSTIAKIKAATAHMKGLKIGIMGCIVNGPGEMADADYGYVGAGPGKISLYKQKICVEKAIPESEAVEHLLRFIEEDRKA